jgi:hypothetical protein
LLVLSPGWPQTHDLPALPSQVLGFQVCATIPSERSHFTAVVHVLYILQVRDFPGH